MAEVAVAGGSNPAPKEHHKLGQLASTAICGNDITSSCLYVSALAIVYAGKLAPISLLMVAAVLFLFRRIYAEVVGALPLNGGAYNALLNTTSKRAASVAACLTVLSYMATAVISALEGMHYVHNNLWGDLNIMAGTIGLLAFFMFLTIIGITESAVVAIVIFITHLATLTLLLIVGLTFVFSNGGNHPDGGLATARSNFSEPLPAPPGTSDEFADLESDEESTGAGSLFVALFFGFAVSMLGISGFESSSNFVEEQADGVFPKTLRNMWIAVSFFNPLMALLALSVLSMIQVDENQTALLAYMGEVAGGKWLSTLISIDAAMVLSGAVLTSFVGVTGLVHRMTLDRCLPQFLLKTNKRGTTHRIIIAFFLLCVSVLLITHNTVPDDAAATVVAAAKTADIPEDASPDVARRRVNRAVLSLDDETLSADGKYYFRALSKKDRSQLPSLSEEAVQERMVASAENAQIKKLAGIYTISFLAVMALFGFGNVLLKLKRNNLPRPARASWPAVIVAIAAVVAGLVGNALIDSAFVWTFLQYFVPAMLVIGIMLFRISLLKAALLFVRSLTAGLVGPMTRLTRWVRVKIDHINAQQIVFFTRGDNIANLNNALLYVRENEHTNRLKIVTVATSLDDVPDSLGQELEFLDQAYPEIDVEFVKIEGRFSPELIQQLSDEWDIPTNLMFIGSPGGRLPYGLAELGGVRLII